MNKHEYKYMRYIGEEVKIHTLVTKE